MELCSLTPNLALTVASQLNGVMFRLLKTRFRGYYLALKWIRGVVSGVKGLTCPLGLALNPTSYHLIYSETKKKPLN